MRRLLLGAVLAAGAVIMGSGGDAQASSHREAPFVTKHPKVDSSDFYMFMSYESGRTDYVTILANYLPLQDAWGGPNYFELDPEALYEVHVDNNGDGNEDITFQFNFHHALNGDGLAINLGGDSKTNDVPLLNIGGIAVGDNSKLRVLESYDVTMVKGDRRTGTPTSIKTAIGKPVDNIGTTSIANYDAYAKSFVTDLTIPGCGGNAPATNNAKVFVGQRREGFAANIGVIFDLIEAPAAAAVVTGGGDRAGRGYDAANPFNTGTLYRKNVTTLALEIHKDCLLAAGGPTIIGGWTSASMRQARVLNPNETYTLPAKEGGAWTQVSHLGMPLVNEVVIGLKDKDSWNASAPKDTAKYADYVTHPTLPALIEILYGAASGGAVAAPKPVRADLVAAFAQGVTVKNHADGTTDVPITTTSTGGNAAVLAEYLRLNTGLGAKTAAQQTALPADVHGLGALGCFADPAGTPAAGALREIDLTSANCDPTGFPNGRRPGDDVVDITLRVAMGALFARDADAPSRNIPFTDANYNGIEQFDAAFPYLRDPIPGNATPGAEPN